MHNEQVFTPEHVVDTMFEELEYKGNNIRKKHMKQRNIQQRE